MQVDHPFRAQRRIQRRPVQVLTAPVAPRLHESTEPVVAGSCLALRPSFIRRRETLAATPFSGLTRSVVGRFPSKRFFLHSSETRSKSCPLAPSCFQDFFATMGKSDSRPGPCSGLCIPRRRLDSGYLPPCPSRRVSRVPRRSFEYMPSPNAPGGMVRRSCFPIAPLAGFPIYVEGHRRHACNEAEASSLALRPALYLTLRPFPARLTPRVTPARRAGDFAVNRQLPRAELSSARIARASPGARVFTGGNRVALPIPNVSYIR